MPNNILSRFNFLFNAVRDGRLDVTYVVDSSKYYLVDWSFFRSMSLGEILLALDNNCFIYDGEAI